MRLPSLAFDPNTDWHAWRRQVFGLQGMLLLLFVGLALGLHWAEPYLLAEAPQPIKATSSQQEVIDAVVEGRLAGSEDGSTMTLVPLATLKGGAQELDGQAVRVRGRLAQHTRDENGNRLLVLRDQNAEVWAVYTGYLGNLYPGEPAEVEGRWRASQRAIDADSAHTVTLRAALRDDPTTSGTAATAVRALKVMLPVLALVIFATRWIVTRHAQRRSPVAPGRIATTGLLLVGLVLTASACRVQQVVRVNPDGSGKIVTLIEFDASQMQQLRDQPNMGSYLTSLKDNIEAEGAATYNYAVGDTEYLLIERPFSSVEQVDSWGSNLGLRVVDSGSDRVFEYRTTIEPSRLYPDPAEQGAAQVAGELDKMQWQHQVILPGRSLASSPSPEGLSQRNDASQASWSVSGKQPLMVRFVSQQVNSEAIVAAERRLRSAISFEERLVESLQYSSMASAAILLLALLVFRPAVRKGAS